MHQIDDANMRLSLNKHYEVLSSTGKSQVFDHIHAKQYTTALNMCCSIRNSLTLRDQMLQISTGLIITEMIFRPFPDLNYAGKGLPGKLPRLHDHYRLRPWAKARRMAS